MKSKNLLGEGGVGWDMGLSGQGDKKIANDFRKIKNIFYSLQRRLLGAKILLIFGNFFQVVGKRCFGAKFVEKKAEVDRIAL